MVEENKQLQARALGLIHACTDVGSGASYFPNLNGGWSDDEMANILFAFRLKYPMQNDVAITFSNQDPNGTIVVIVKRNTEEQKLFTFNVSGARERVATIFEKSKVLVERRNNAVGATPSGEGKETD